MSDPQISSASSAGFVADQPTAPVETGVFVCVHGHFYQPPRENPYLESVERQPSAAPFHDWNERILHECYRPNAFARILNDQGEVLHIVNNYEYLSFNIGPTLMSWLERHDLETYRQILAADRLSCDRNNGHGNAIAQVYNHIIMPLANPRDKETQVHWGIADFRRRFGRDPEGIWLAETGVDYDTLRVLIKAGIRFTILAPSQVQRCRVMASGDQPAGEWHEVGGGQIDPTRPYRCFVPGLPEGENYIDLFFYDGPISRDMGFNDVLSSSQMFAGRLGQAIRGERDRAQLISVATDGETFGHHRGGAEKALAYAMIHEFPQQGWQVTNFAHYLSLFPPTWEAELKPVTAWSCAHGVDRWQDDCGCGGGGEWHQRWRKPLRQSLDWLRDRLIQVYETYGSELFIDPWQARNDYIEVIGDSVSAATGRNPRTIHRFLSEHQTHKLTSAEKIDALRLLEMQRHTLLMYTSCGWFFEEISRPEGTQILRYAARAIELAEEVSGQPLEEKFVRQLEAAPSNVSLFGNGKGLFQQLVAPSRVGLEQIAAHYAISSLFNTYHREQALHCYTLIQKDYQRQTLGSLTLAVGQVQISSDITLEKVNFDFAVLHLGGWDFHCGIQPAKSRPIYTRAKTAVLEAFGRASIAQSVVAINQYFGDRTFSLQDLFSEERHRIMQLLSRDTLQRLDQLYTQIYRENYGVLMAFHRDHLEVPQELQVAAEIALSHRALTVIKNLEQDLSDLDDNVLPISANYIAELEGIATEANHFHCQLRLPGAKAILEQLILRTLWLLLQAPLSDGELPTQELESLNRLILLGNSLNLGLSLDKAQEMYYGHLGQLRSHLPQAVPAAQSYLAKLGQYLAVDVVL
jgi:alpha-amylase/alpha-mannosidase (GH57 family)